MSMLPATRSRRRLTVLSAAVALIGGGVVASNLAGAASGPSALDYAQCSNGAPGTTAGTGCPGSWINGILNANNSQFREDEVTPQRLTMSVKDTGAPGATHTHSVTLSYLDRKGGIHAYDSLAQVDATQTDADTDSVRCLNITAICPAGPASTTPIVADTNSVGPASGGNSAVVATHQLPNQNLMVFGATFTGVATPMTVPTHDNALTNSGDDYATTTITFLTTGPGTHNIQLLFGGHLAVGAQPNGNQAPRGWGVGLGASSVSGGPYHIKWQAADGASVGNRDNQIMSNAILTIVPQGSTLSTTPSTTEAAVGSTDLSAVTDTAELTPDSHHAPTGTMGFTLYGPLTAPDYNDCTDPVGGVGGNVVAGPDTGHSLALKSGTTNTYTATSNAVDMTGFDPGVYQWVANYDHSSDQFNTDEAGTCGDSTERVTIDQGSASGTSTQTITDTVDVSSDVETTPTGSVSFFAYSSLADCTADAGNSTGTGDVFESTDVDLSSGSATSDGFTPDSTSGGPDFWWRVYYNGDTSTAAGEIESCGTQTFSIANGS